MIRIYCKNTGSTLEFPEGVSLLEVLGSFEFDKPYPILAAKVNNVLQGLKYRAFNSRDVEFLDYTTYSGRSVYCRSLCFVASKAVRDLFPEAKIKMRRPISKGYFCTVTKDGALTGEQIEDIRERMQEIIAADLPFRRIEARAEDAINVFRKTGDEDKVKLLETSSQVYINYHVLDKTPDYYYDALLPSTGLLKVWDIVQYEEGFILRVPDRHNPGILAPFKEQPKTFGVFREYMRWNEIMKMENVGDVNHICQAGGAKDLIRISEALQDRKLFQIADEIDRRFRGEGLKMVLITGPSSSGKTTVCSKLAVQLMACGIHPVVLSTDDYFVNREDTRKFPDGTYDFDHFDTVEHVLMEKHINLLLEGEEVSVPSYNFVTGKREYNGRLERLDGNSILLVEGIHALNPALTASIEDSRKFKVFINTIVSISLDDHNCIPTSDNRLLRRIVRDANKGAYTARATISNWPNVRRAETLWIYPYQETADVLFNSAYLVEFAVMRSHAERILLTVPRNCPEYSEASRLLHFLSYFVRVSDSEIPSTSMLREFVGRAE